MLYTIIIIACAAIIAAVSIFGTLYDPGHPWMDKRRRVGAVILCIAAFVEVAAILIGHA